MASRAESRLVRQLRLIFLLYGRKRGASLAELIELLGIKRSSFYRYIDELQKADVPLEKNTVNGEVRYRLTGAWAGAPGPTELFALTVANGVLRGLVGAKSQRWLEPRLRQLPFAVTMEEPVEVPREVSTVVERAIMEGYRLELHYRGLKDKEPKRRVVEAAELRFSDRAWYLFGIDVEKETHRTFKLPRIAKARMLSEKCRFTKTGDAAAAHAHAVGVWTSTDLHDVAVRVLPPFAQVVTEFPLNGSRTIEEAGDCVIVRARVSGLEEITRWVLQFGAHAIPLAPPVLVERVEQSLQSMLALLHAEHARRAS
jgi:predicted DNA-binding transcriptional regulator YafY